ncbi:MAG: RodZ domain-containing protein [Candidatus Korobacteraceae bacterium]
MSTFGERLRRERELRNISLDEIAATTKVGTRLLRALEDEQFDQLPGGIFNKGYVRAYAKYVGIDEEQAVADYLQAADEATPDVHGNAEQNVSIRYAGEQLDDVRRSTFPVVPVFIVLVLIAGIIGGWRIYRERRIDRQPQSESTPTSAAVPNNSGVISPNTSIPANTSAPIPQTVSGKNVSPQQITPASAPGTAASQSADSSNPASSFELTVRPTDRAWVSIKSDDKFVVRGIIKPPDVKTIRATGQIVFWTGNVGAVEVSFNGKNVPLTGGENEERVLVFNSHGLLPGTTPQ